MQIETSGLGEMESVPWFGGTLFYAAADGGAWSAWQPMITDDDGRREIQTEGAGG